LGREKENFSSREEKGGKSALPGRRKGKVPALFNEERKKKKGKTPRDLA